MNVFETRIVPIGLMHVMAYMTVDVELKTYVLCDSSRVTFVLWYSSRVTFVVVSGIIPCAGYISIQYSFYCVLFYYLSAAQNSDLMLVCTLVYGIYHISVISTHTLFSCSFGHCIDLALWLLVTPLISLIFSYYQSLVIMI